MLILAAVAVTTAGMFFLSTLKRPPAISPGARGGTGYPQLVSVQQMAQNEETGTLDPVDVSPTMMVVSPEKTLLFDALPGRRCCAPWLRFGETGVNARPLPSTNSSA